MSSTPAARHWTSPNEDGWASGGHDENTPTRWLTIRYSISYLSRTAAIAKKRSARYRLGRSHFSTDKVLTIDLTYEPDDMVHRIRGVGGAEFIFTKQIDRLAAGNLQVNDFQIEVGAMDYGFDIDGIIGMDFLIQVGAIVDLTRLEMYTAP